MKGRATAIALAAAALAALAALAAGLPGCRSKEKGADSADSQNKPDSSGAEHPESPDQIAFNDLVDKLLGSGDRRLDEAMLDDLAGLVEAGPRIEPMLLAVWDETRDANLGWLTPGWRPRPGAVSVIKAKRKETALGLLWEVGGALTAERLRPVVAEAESANDLTAERPIYACIRARLVVDQIVERNGCPGRDEDEILLRLMNSKPTGDRPVVPASQPASGDGLLTAEEAKMADRIAEAAAERYVRRHYPPVDFSPLARYLRDLRHIARQEILERIADAADARFLDILALELNADPAHDDDKANSQLVRALIESWPARPADGQPPPERSKAAQAIIAAAKELAAGTSAQDLRDQVDLLLKVINR